MPTLPQTRLVTAVLLTGLAVALFAASSEAQPGDSLPRVAATVIPMSPPEDERNWTVTCEVRDSATGAPVPCVHFDVRDLETIRNTSLPCGLTGGVWVGNSNTGKDGRKVLKFHSAHHEFSISAEKTLYQIERRDLILSDEHPHATLQISLRPAGRIEMTVRSVSRGVVHHMMPDCERLDGLSHSCSIEGYENPAIDNLPPGRYLLSVTDDLFHTWYLPGTQDRTKARPIDVVAGTVTHATITLP